MITLETERLILRPFQETDLEDFYEYAKNPHVGPSAGWPPHDSKEDSLKILTMFMSNNEVWAIVNKENSKLIGSIGLHTEPLRSTDDVKMLGYVLSEDYRGRGLMVEASKAAINYAFEHMDLQLLAVHHYPSNQQSRRVIEKCGFVHEGTLRHAKKIYDGSVHDVVCYSMTRDEWMDKLRINY